MVLKRKLFVFCHKVTTSVDILMDFYRYFDKKMFDVHAVILCKCLTWQYQHVSSDINCLLWQIVKGMVLVKGDTAWPLAFIFMTRSANNGQLIDQIINVKNKHKLVPIYSVGALQHRTGTSFEYMYMNIKCKGSNSCLRRLKYLIICKPLIV